ncbi:MAG: hypothetical protein WKF37_07845 [Bryobacteraceae bacterium]
MSVYRIFRMRESVRQQFRWSPHTIGTSVAKLKDYEQIAEMAASGPYGICMQLKESPNPLMVGDILESENGELCIYKYVGFEEAVWQVPELKAGVEDLSSPMGPSPMPR